MINDETGLALELFDALANYHSPSPIPQIVIEGFYFDGREFRATSISRMAPAATSCKKARRASTPKVAKTKTKQVTLPATRTPRAARGSV